MRIPARLAATALTALLAVPAFAETSPSGPIPGSNLAGRLDLDGDKSVSRQEAIAARERLFDRIDRDGDGRVVQAEIESLRDAIANLATMLDALAASAPRRLDADGDGAISRLEFTTRTRLFALLDRNDDDRLDPDELARARAIFAAPKP